jgi:5'-phosphate synthase pdxT subunit
LTGFAAVPPSAGQPSGIRVGILASQGGFAAHARMLRTLGAEPVEVRAPEHFPDLAALIIPGGESTTITKAIERDGLAPAIHGHVERGGAVLGTCAGLIVCDREHLGLIDATARRNAFGRQIASFEADLRIEGIGEEAMRAVFVRAPWIEDHGDQVQVLAEFEGHPVAVRQGSVLACSFHPELADDPRLHALLMAIAEGSNRFSPLDKA